MEIFETRPSIVIKIVHLFLPIVFELEINSIAEIFEHLIIYFFMSIFRVIKMCRESNIAEHVCTDKCTIVISKGSVFIFRGQSMYKLINLIC